MAVVLPPFQVPDEYRHWIAAIKNIDLYISDGGVVCSKFLALPDHFQSREIPFNAANKQITGKFSSIFKLSGQCPSDNVHYSTILSYPGVLLAYIIAGYRDNSLLVLATYYFSRIFHGLLIFALLLRFYFLSSRMPKFMPGTLSLLALATAPLFIQQSFAVSSDVVVNLSAIALVHALVFRRLLKIIDVIIICLACVMAAFTKVVVAPMFFVVGVILLCDSRKTLRKVPNENITLCTTVGIFLLLLVPCCFLFAMNYRELINVPLGHGIQSEKQLQLIIAEPMRVVGYFLHEIFALISPFSVPQKLGWLDTHLFFRGLELWRIFIWGSLIVDFLQICFFYFNNLPRFTSKSLILKTLAFRSGIILFILLGPFGYLFAVCAALYIWNTPYQLDWVWGVQPRYFFPFYVFLFGLIPSLFIPRLQMLQTLDKPKEITNYFALQMLLMIGLLIVGVFYAYFILFSLAYRYW